MRGGAPINARLSRLDVGIGWRISRVTPARPPLAPVRRPLRRPLARHARGPRRRDRAAAHPCGRRGPRPCLRAATRWVQGEDLVCVCGTFPSPAAWSGLLLGGQPAGTPVSASSEVVWLRLPPGFRSGRYAISGRREAGFAPACAAETELVVIHGQIDIERLLRGDSTPMRLRIESTADPVPLRLRNLTPAIIAIEGGVEQQTETSGGEGQATHPPADCGDGGHSTMGRGRVFLGCTSFYIRSCRK